MTTKVFVSHSKQDEELVGRIEESLDILDFDSVMYEKEEVPDFQQDEGAIIQRLKGSDACFVFPTPTVRQRKVTPAWLIAESAIARTHNIPTLIFKEEGDFYGINFPFFHALVVYKDGRLPIELQKRMKSIEGEQNPDPCSPLQRAVVSMTQGVDADDIFIDAILTPSLSENEKDTGTPIQCNKCDKKFVYWGEGSCFNCPHCHALLWERLNSINRDKFKLG